jgi:ABC-2 type transport system ATP-binding protein
VVEVRVQHGARPRRGRRILAPLGTEAPHFDEPARRVAVPVSRAPPRSPTAVRLIAEQGIELDDIGLRRPTLDEVFLALTGAPS